MTEINEGVGGPGASGAADESEQGVRLRIVEILGLYRPGFSDRRHRADRRVIACGYQPGYTSSDDRGRIFVNHRPRTGAAENWQQARSKDTQYIEARVELVDPSGVVPGSAKVRWSYSLEEDPTLEGMRDSAADYIRPSGGCHGVCDHPSPGAADHPVFEALGAYPGQASGEDIETALVDGQSGVRMHCTNAGGDCYRLRATLVGGPSPEPTDQSGHMSMWKRIDVEYHRMDGVRELRVERVATAFEIAYVQLDFTAEIPLDHRPAITSGADRVQPAQFWCDRHFRRRRQPGWFLLIAADLDTSLVSSDPPQKVYPPDPDESAIGALGTTNFPGADENPYQVVTIPVVLPREPEVKAIRLYEGGEELIFYANGTYPGRDHPNTTTVVFRRQRFHPDPQAGEGDETGSCDFIFARPIDYGPRVDSSGPGLGFPLEVQCSVWTGHAIGASGITPPYPYGDDDYFAGRSMVFMGRFENDEQAVRTATHELCHAFGFSHNCGRRDVRRGASEGCAMTILNFWSYRDGTTQLERWSALVRGVGFCERHLLGLRTIHLEDNPYMWRWS